MNRLSFTLALCAVAWFGASCAEDDAAAPPDPDSLGAELQDVLDEAVAKSEVLLPGAIAHYREPSRPSWSGSAGLANLEQSRPMRPSDRVRAGSVPKTFLATVTLQLVEEGTLSLDQTLPELLPADVTQRIPNAEQITLRMLLNHTSGIPDWVTDEVHTRVASEPGHIWTEQETLDIMAREPAMFAPGTSWSYSNTNYTLVGMVLERAGGESWRAQVRARVLEPLGLKATQLPEPGEHTVSAEYARGYEDIAGRPADLSDVDSSMAGAGGGHAMVTTAQDLARFLDALLAGRLFERAATLQEMTAMIDAPEESGFPHQYGLGLETFEFPNGVKVIGHAGSTAGYSVMMYQLQDRPATVVTALNTGSLFTNALEVFMPVTKVVAAKAH